MGTNNFYSNARTIFAVLMNYEDEIFDENGEPTGETEMRSCEEWDYDDLKDHAIELMEQSKFSYSDSGNFSNNRNFEGTLLGSLNVDKYFGDVLIEVRINAVIRSGYYEGANLDYEVEYYSGCGQWEDSINFGYDFENHSDMSRGLQVIQTKNAERWAEKITEELEEELEKIFTQLSTPYNKVGQFSNGEAVYQKVG
jgi:hypothetical protein